MAGPPRLDLVHKAISAGTMGHIEWQDAAYRRVRNDPDIQGLTPQGIRLHLRDFVKAGNCLEVRNETREEYRHERAEHPFWYRAILPVPGIPGFPNGLFVEVLLVDEDEQEPWVQIVNAHAQ